MNQITPIYWAGEGAPDTEMRYLARAYIQAVDKRNRLVYMGLPSWGNGLTAIFLESLYSGEAVCCRPDHQAAISHERKRARKLVGGRSRFPWLYNQCSKSILLDGHP